MDANVIKEYLVSLGFSIDNAQYAKINATIKELGKKVEDVATGMGKQVAKSGTVIISTLASITAATVIMMDKVAQADIGYQKFALHMYMNEAAAKKFKIATDALGESMIDIARNPELLQHYRTLMAQAQGMETPGDAGSQLKYLRELRFEFTRLKVEAVYGMQWITYYLFKIMGIPIKNLKEGMKGLNDWMQTKMPVWTNKVAQVLATAMNLLNGLWRPIKMVFKGLKEIYDILPPLGKEIMLLFGVGIMGALFPITTILTTLVLLFDDFWAYIDGRKSAKLLAPIWQIVIDAINMVTMGIFKLGVAMDMIRQGKWKEISKAVDRLFFGKKDYNKNEIDDAMELFQGIGVKQPGTPAGKGDLAGIGTQESGGNYGAINPTSGAIGKYQIMPNNWGPWAKEAGLGPNAPTTPANQEIIAKYKWNQYMKEFGNEKLAATAWYAGPNYARSVQAGKPLFDPNKKQGLYPSVNDYVSGAVGKGGTTVNTNVGGVVVNVQQPNATPEQIKTATLEAIVESEKKAVSRTMRDFQGVNG